MKVATILLLTALTTVSASAQAGLPFDVAPKAIKTVAANRPSNAETAGMVSLLVTVTVEGSVTEAKVLKSTRPEFETAAVDAVMKWKFTPAEKAGQPIEAKIVVPIRFSLEAGE